MAARRAGLGKGLGALIPDDDVAGAVHTPYRELPVGSVTVNPFQPRERFDEETLSALTASIRAIGVLQPILVRPKEHDTFELIAGERRWRAAKRAGMRTIPAIVRELEDLGSLEQALVENIHRQDLSALEEAAAYQQLVEDFSLTQDQIAQRVGRSRSAVANTLRLLQLPASVQALLADGRLSAGHARALLGLASRQEQDALAHEIVADDLTVREVEQRVRAGQVPTRRATGPSSRAPKSAAVLEVEDRLSELLATRVTINSASDKRGRLVVEFAGLDDLERIYQQLLAQLSS